MSRMHVFEFTSAWAVLLTCCQVCVAQHVVPCSARVIALTPDNQRLIVGDYGRCSILDVATGKTLFESEYREGVFEPHGISDDGEWLIGGGYGVQSGSELARAELSPRSIYYAPLKAFEDGTFRQAVREIDMSPFLPLKQSPHLVAFVRRIIDLGDDRYAAIMMIRHEVRKSSKRTAHAVVFSAKEHRMLTACNLDGDAEKIEGDHAQHFPLLTTTRSKRAYSGLRLRYVPIDSSASLQAKTYKQIAPILFAADDGETFLAAGGESALIGDVLAGHQTILRNTSHLGFHRGRLGGTRVEFSSDASRLVVYNAEFRLNAQVRQYARQPIKQATVFDTETGAIIRTINFQATAHRNGVQRVSGFSRDNRYLITQAGDWVSSNSGVNPRIQATVLWDIEDEAEDTGYSE